MRCSVRCAVLTCVALALACEEPDADRSAARGADAGTTSHPGAAAGADAAPDRPHCTAPDGSPTAPQRITDVVALLNALPKPVSLACFVETLDRPLALQAVESIFSAQPAEGRRSPRTFLFFEGVTLSVVPDGVGSRLLELGEHRPDDQSLKAELEFPIESQLDELSPYARVRYDDTISTCGFCHQGEQHADDVPSPSAYVSPAFKARPMQRVPLDEVAAEVAACDEASEPDRCALLHALFDQRPAPQEHEFPASYKTFF